MSYLDTIFCLPWSNDLLTLNNSRIFWSIFSLDYLSAVKVLFCISLLYFLSKCIVYVYTLSLLWITISSSSEFKCGGEIVWFCTVIAAFLLSNLIYEGFLSLILFLSMNFSPGGLGADFCVKPYHLWRSLSLLPLVDAGIDYRSTGVCFLIPTINDYLLWFLAPWISGKRPPEVSFSVVGIVSILIDLLS